MLEGYYQTGHHERLIDSTDADEYALCNLNLRTCGTTMLNTLQ